MLSKTLNNQHIYIDADYKKHDFSRLRLFFTPAGTHLLSTRVCNVLLTDFVKNSGFEFCFSSTQCIETQAGTSNNVTTWVFFRSWNTDAVL